MDIARTARLSRRTVLLGGLGVGAGLLTACRQPEAGPAAPGPDLVRATTPATRFEPVVTSRKLSSGRYREVDVVIVRPEGAPEQPLPVCVALHGGLGGAKSFLTMGLPAMLTQTMRQNVPPFAVVALDGGNWVGHKDDDPQRMLNDDLPGWLDYHDLASTPFAVLGVAEGGAGALNLARTPGFAAVAAISPTLYETWDDAQPSGMFTDEAQWRATEPLRHATEFANLPVGLWCGTGDSDFLTPTREFGRRVDAASAFGPGGHDNDYFKTALPEALKFVGGYL